MTRAHSGRPWVPCCGHRKRAGSSEKCLYYSSDSFGECVRGWLTSSCSLLFSKVIQPFALSSPSILDGSSKSKSRIFPLQGSLGVDLCRAVPGFCTDGWWSSVSTCVSMERMLPHTTPMLRFNENRSCRCPLFRLCMRLLVVVWLWPIVATC